MDSATGGAQKGLFTQLQMDFAAEVERLSQLAASQLRADARITPVI